MYAPFFGFKENPFNLTPDPRYLFLSRYHREALEHLLYGINERKGFIAITGGIGTGKTTLCRALLEHLDPKTQSALIFSSFISDEEILKSINQEFGIEMGPGTLSKKDYVDALNQFLLKNFGDGENALLLIDEAQNLSHAVLEQIRLLSNLETEKEKLLQVVLVGQSELKGLLHSPSLQQLNERITVRYDLRPLDEADLRGYVHHRLTVAGGRGEVGFSNGALRAVYGYSRGNPRRINAVCDRALLIAFTKEKRMISKKMVKDAVRDLKGEGSDARTSGVGPPLFVRGGWSKSRAGAVLLLVMLMAGLFVWRQGGDIMEVFSSVGRVNGTPAPAASTQDTPTPEIANAAVFLDQATSLANLFRLFEDRVSGGSDYGEGAYLGLVSFDIASEYFILFKKPFRVLAAHVASPLGPGPRYLLITQTRDNGAVALDPDGGVHKVTRSFVLRHWGGEVSFVYPHRQVFQTLSRGMKGREVLKVQEVLKRVGYLVELTAVYDPQTAEAVARFQEEFGLNADGIVGPRTMALLFQMWE